MVNDVYQVMYLDKKDNFKQTIAKALGVDHSLKSVCGVVSTAYWVGLFAICIFS
jgi:hypothetical protein